MDSGLSHVLMYNNNKKREINQHLHFIQLVIELRTMQKKDMYGRIRGYLRVDENFSKLCKLSKLTSRKECTLGANNNIILGKGFRVDEHLIRIFIDFSVYCNERNRYFEVWYDEKNSIFSISCRENVARKVKIIKELSRDDIAAKLGVSIIKNDAGEIMSECWCDNNSHNLNEIVKMLNKRKMMVTKDDLVKLVIPHRLGGGPARIWYRHGRIYRAMWCLNGKKHNNYGPAEVYYGIGGDVKNESFFKNGKERKIYDGTASVFYINQGPIFIPYIRNSVKKEKEEEAPQSHINENKMKKRKLCDKNE